MTTITASGIHSNEYNPIIENLPEGWASAKVTYEVNGEKKARIQIIDMREDPPMQYRHDSMFVISIKCALITAAIPLFLAPNLLFHCVRTTVLVARTLFRSLFVLLTERNEGSLNKFVHDWTWEGPAALLQGIRDFVKAPFCALDMAFCAFFGIFSPLEGRVLVAAAERRWRGSKRKYDIKRFEGNLRGFFTDLFTNRHSKNCFFMAYCFQPIGNVNLNQIERVEFLIPTNGSDHSR